MKLWLDLKKQKERFASPHEQIIFANSPLYRPDMGDMSPDEIQNLWQNPKLRLVGFVENKPLMNITGALDIYYFTRDALSPSFFKDDGEWGNSWVFIGFDRQEQSPVFAVDMGAIAQENLPPWRDDLVKPIDLRSVAGQFGNFAIDQGRAALLGTAKSLLDWHKNHSFCACCGEKTKVTRGGLQRVCTHNACGKEHFPRVDPVVIMLIFKDEECLLGRGIQFMNNSYSALAGFIEAGETIEEAVRRETMEEVGIKIGQVRYIQSQPWPFPSSLMIGCFAEAEDKEIYLNKNELADARWFTRSELKAQLKGDEGLDFLLPSEVAIAHHLIRLWLEQR